MADTTTIWSPIPGPQTALVTCPVFEVFYGGARGGGKTDGVLGEWLSHADKYGEHAIGLMVRRERTQLIETIERSRMLYAPLGAKYHEQDKMWRFPNGARLRFAYLESDSDADAYQGHSYTRVYVEEVGTFPRPEPVLKLMATLRSGSGVPCGFRATGNPGGPGHNWVRSRYIDPAPFGWDVGTRSFRNPFTGAEVSRDWVYIPSRLADNHYLGDQYVANLFMSGSPALVKAWLEGDWSAIEGAFFDCWSPLKHIVRPFAIPEDWLRFRSMDWGSAAPFSVGWWAVVGDDAKIEGQVLPRGALVRYREWYGKGGKLTAEEVAQGIIERERSDAHLIKYGVLDPSAFAQDGGPSIAERMHAAGRRLSSPLMFRPADNKRVAARGAMGGWDQMRSRMKGGPDGRPMLVTFTTCPDFIRTIPVLQHDKDKPEDLDCWVAGTPIATPGGDTAIEQVRAGDVVCTPIGPRRVLRSYVSGAGATAWVETADGRRLEGTPHHKVYVKGRGLVALEDVRCYDMLIQRSTAWQERALSTAVSLTRGMVSAATTIRTGLLWLKAGLAFIGRCGLMLTGRSLPAGISTISTATSTITSWTTSPAYPPQTTFGFTTPRGRTYRISSGNGEPARLAWASSEITPARCESGPRDVNVRAGIVASLLRRDTLGSYFARLSALRPRALNRSKRIALSVASASGPSGAPRKLKPAHIIAVGRSDELKPVFNLTVDEAHMFYASGMLSSNTEAEDHAADECFVAGTMIRTDSGQRPIERFRVGDSVEVRGGCVSTVAAVFSVGTRVVYALALSDGSTVVGTAEHPVFIEGEGFAPLASLRYGDMVRPWTEKPYYLTGEPTTVGRGILGGTGASIIGRIAARCTALFGKRRTARFPLSTSSTTSTTTRSITIWRTLLSWLLASTPITIGRSGSQSREHASIAASPTAPAHGPLSGSVQTPARRRPGEPAALTMNCETAQSADAPSPSIGTQNSGTVLRPAPRMASTSVQPSSSIATDAANVLLRHRPYPDSAPLHVVSVTPAGSAQVFNLTVEAGEYFANGILVHNCRYACMSRPWIAEPAGAKEPRPMMVGSGNRATLNDAWQDRDAANMQQRRI